MQQRQTAGAKNSIVFKTKDGALVRFTYQNGKFETSANDKATQSAILTLKTHLKSLIKNFGDKKRSIPERVNKIAAKISNLEFGTLRIAVNQFQKIEGI